MGGLRECMKKMVKGLDGDENLLDEAMRDLGLQSQFKDLVKFLLLGGEHDQGLAQRAANQSHEQNIQAVTQKLEEFDLNGLNAEISKLMNILVFAGGLAIQ